jgi:pyruvate carboxylase
VRTLLIANRGEIAIRAARAAREMGVTSVAVYAPEDRSALHRLISDRAYEIGKPGHPVRSYLDIDTLIAVAREAGADAVYPGYGFLSESAPFAQACLDAGLTFVGPPPQTLSLTGDKVRAREAAVAAGVPVLAASGPIRSVEEGLTAAAAVGFPLFIKASAGGGGRGMRRIETADGFAETLASASREAEAAFGDPTVFLEQAITRPRHVEIQVLADATGAVIHLFERDCSVQRRHQKVVEIAPAPGLPVALLDRLAEHAVAFARSVGYVSAGTVEFLVWADPDQRAADHVGGYGYAFIEMNPRIQVEHTVTEEVTGVDLVLAQLQIADGATLADLGLAQPTTRPTRTAIQCRLTTEDPAEDFRPSTGTILAYRSPGGPGIRLDGATYTGAEISPYYDSLLVKMTTSGADLQQAARRARRGLDEFRVRGVSTNVGFLRALLEEPDFLGAELSTAFLDEHPRLLEAAQRGPGSGLLTKLAEVTVNRPHGRPVRELTVAPSLLPSLVGVPDQLGTRDILNAEGPQGLARHLRGRTALPVTDTSLRDAHQSLLATRVRTIDLVAGARATAELLPSLVSLECWGGATFDAALRFLREDPWDRLTQLREAAPHVALQMLIRGRNLLGYAPYPRPVITAFVAEAVSAGIDILRVFDALNDIEQMRDVISATRDAGAYSEGAICYTGDLLDPEERTYTLDYYLRIADDLVAAGVHGLVIKDMAGLLRAPAAIELITALRDRFDVPVRLHTHDTAGGQMATYLAAAEAGVDGVDCASAPIASGGSQPAMGALVAAMAHTDRDTGLDLADVLALEPFWEAVRDTYQPFEAGQRSPSTRVYRHEVPGGQLSNLRAQAEALGVGDRFDEVLEAYADANIILGRPVKVTPSSKVVGDLALWLVTSGVTREELLADGARYDLPASVVAFLHGQLGTPAGGFVQPFTDAVTAARPQPAAPAVDEADLALLTDAGSDAARRRLALSRLMLPAEAAGLAASLEEFGDVSVIPTIPYLYGLQPGRVERIEVAPGQTWFVELDAIGDVDETGHRRVHLWANGQPWALRVLDTSATGTRPARRRVDPGDPGQIGTTVPGVITVTAAVGAEVAAGDRIAVVEAMKMESVVTAPRDGTVTAVHLASGDQVEAGDLVAEIA